MSLQASSKTLLLSIVIAAGLIGSVFMYLESQKTTVPDEPSNIKALDDKTTPTIPHEVDTDQDGLLDWEEELWGSNPEKVDTDEDGLDDHSEILNGRHPAIPAPNDLLSTNVYLQIPGADLEEYERYRLEFLGNYMTRRGQEIRDDVVAALISDIDATPYVPNHTLDDLQIVSLTTASSTLQYAQTLQRVLNDYASSSLEGYDELVIIENAMDTFEPKDFEKLRLISIFYEDLSDSLLEIEVPVAVANEHLALVNGNDGLSMSVTGMGEILDNPITALTAYESYLAQKVMIETSLALIVNYYINSGLGYNIDTGEFSINE